LGYSGKGRGLEIAGGLEGYCEGWESLEVGKKKVPPPSGRVGGVLVLMSVGEAGAVPI